jgi:DNA-binding cell septation regulator SpoVG
LTNIRNKFILQQDSVNSGKYHKEAHDVMGMEIKDVTAEIRLNTKPGAVKAYADVRIETGEGVLWERGYAVIQKEKNAPFIGFPSRAGTTQGKFFPIIEAEGDIRKAIMDAIFTAYKKTLKQ